MACCRSFFLADHISQYRQCQDVSCQPGDGQKLVLIEYEYLDQEYLDQYGVFEELVRCKPIPTYPENTGQHEDRCQDRGGHRKSFECGYRYLLRIGEYQDDGHG